MADVTKSAVGHYAEYEQLVGGVETLFKDSSGKLIDYAEKAYKTAGMSSNQYMNTATSFAASLIHGLGGDTAKAVELTNLAITDMSDNANKMGNNGHSGTNRIDLIVFRYTKDSTGKETVDLVVIQGEDSTGTATAPTAVDGNILTGAMQSDFPLYSVELNGINIVKVNPLFNVIGNISKLKEELTELNSNLVKTAVYMNNGAYNIAPSNSEFQGTDFSKKILDNIGLVHNYDATNYKHTFTVPQDGISDGAVKIL